MRITLLFLLLVLPLGLQRAHADIEPTTSAKIGFVLPLSGDWAFLGNGIRDGALLAQRDLETKGQKLTLIFEDNQGQLTSSASAAKKLIEVQKVDALISIISGVSKLLKPLATHANIINIGICSDTEVADGQHSFINYLTAEQGVSKFLEHYGQGKSLGIFALNESGFQRVVSVLRRQASSRVKILYEESFDKGTIDFRPLLIKRSKYQADSLLILGLSPEIETIVKQARSIGITTPVTSIEGFGLASDKTPFEGAWFIDSAVPNAEFLTRFSKVFGREVTPGVGHSYDSVMLLADALQSAVKPTGEIDRIKAVATFRKLHDFSGVTGKLHVQSDGVIWGNASVKKIKDGKPVLLAQ
jgi:branched-chain amino acid transport system substrate-binding protein